MNNTFVNPVANGADPFVFKDTDGTYYMYVTSGGNYGYRVYTSKNLVEWAAAGYCMRREGAYSDGKHAPGVYNFWAPEIFKEGDTYYMICTVQEHLQLAEARSPLGPFQNKTGEHLFPLRSIDGHFFRDDDGQVYLYFVGVGPWESGGDAVETGNNIWAAPFDLAKGCATAAPRLMVGYDRGQGHVIAEAPEVLKHGGKYYLTYSSYDFRSPAYSVCYATADNPLGPFTKYADNPILQSDDIARADTANPHLYGTGHHCFTTSPDDSELIMVYHAHRTGSAPEGVSQVVGERRICVDRAWFDADGILHAGSLHDGVPTATAQALPSGGTRTRVTHYDGVFAALETLPTVYVAATDGLDTNAGTKDAPFKTLAAAHAALPHGGTVVLTQDCNTGAAFVQPKVDGPVCITSALMACPLLFKSVTLQSDTYFDNVVFFPEVGEGETAVIDAGAVSVTMGEGVSCLPQLTADVYPHLTGRGEHRIYGGKFVPVQK